MVTYLKIYTHVSTINYMYILLNNILNCNFIGKSILYILLCSDWPIHDIHNGIRLPVQVTFLHSIYLTAYNIHKSILSLQIALYWIISFAVGKTRFINSFKWISHEHNSGWHVEDRSRSLPACLVKSKITFAI